MATRRHMLKLVGGGGTAAAGFLSLAGCGGPNDALQVWEGEALGAPGFIKLYGLDSADAALAFIKAQAVIERLSDSFSLYRPHSEISRLNREGRLNNASPAMVELVTLAKQISDLTDGAFDISVQVLWDLVQNLNTLEVIPEKTRRLWEKAYALVNYKAIKVEGNAIWFSSPAMAITLNGIAQGYITQKVAQALHQPGIKSALVNIGEFQAFGGRAFTVGIQDPRNVLDTIITVSLRNDGLATSSGKGGYLGGALSHIFTPQENRWRVQFASASVVHASAAMADGLATAFTLMDENAIRSTAKKAAATQVILVTMDNRVISF